MLCRLPIGSSLLFYIVHIIRHSIPVFRLVGFLGVSFSNEPILPRRSAMHRECLSVVGSYSVSYVVTQVVRILSIAPA
jgi:hypothetical protein